MKSQAIELPKPKRARGGWVIYATSEDSICPYHQFCAYSGSEKDRCAECHSNTHSTSEHGDLPPARTAPCLCSRCGELFTSVTGFRIHFGVTGKCRNPERRGLILVRQKDKYGTVWSLWAKPGSRPEDI
jgi:hypothetical protein